MTKPLIALPYIRVSTTRQKTEGVSLSAQQQTIQAYCDMKSWVLQGVVYRDASSGRSRKKRPGLASLLKQAEIMGPECVVVVAKLDRLGRSTIDLCQIATKLNEWEVSLALIDASIDTTTAGGQMVFGILATLAEYESNLISERIRSANSYVKGALGYNRQGRPPAGYKLVDGHRVLVEEEQDWLDILRRAKAGRTYRHACGVLNRHRIPTLTALRGNGDRVEWTSGTLAGVLASAKKADDEMAEMESEEIEDLP